MVKAILAHYPSATDMMMRVSPDRQTEFTAEPTKAFRKGFPTLTDISGAYGENAAKAWLTAQLINLSAFCGCREKMTNEQILDIEGVIVATYPHLMLSELLLFFGWFKAGRYGKFYGVVDPLVITNALKDFMVERGEYKAKIYQEQAEKERSRAGIKYAEHCRLNGIDPKESVFATYFGLDGKLVGEEKKSR